MVKLELTKSELQVLFQLADEGASSILEGSDAVTKKFAKNAESVLAKLRQLLSR